MSEPAMVQLRTLDDVPALLALLPSRVPVVVSQNPLWLQVRIRGVQHRITCGQWLIRDGDRLAIGWQTAADVPPPGSHPSRRGAAAHPTALDDPSASTTVHLPATA